MRRRWALALLGGLALFLYGFVATFHTEPHFGRILAAYGGVFVAGTLGSGVLLERLSAPTAMT
jgi:small multidrug resistance family-3 protein